MALKKRHMLSYLAGIFDGEGCVGIMKISPKHAKRPTPNFRGYAEVQMSEKFIPQLFQNTFGGELYLYKLRNPRYKTMYKWIVRDYHCIAFLKDILPFVLIKRPEAEVVLHFLRDKQEGQYGRGKRLTDEVLALREADYILAKSMKLKGRRNELEDARHDNR